MNKIKNIRNVLAKTILMIIGSILMVSLFWGYILQGFNLNTSPAKEWSKNDSILFAIGFVLMIGAAYYNRILDYILSFLKK